VVSPCYSIPMTQNTHTATQDAGKVARGLWLGLTPLRRTLLATVSVLLVGGGIFAYGHRDPYPTWSAAQKKLAFAGMAYMRDLAGPNGSIKFSEDRVGELKTTGTLGYAGYVIDNASGRSSTFVCQWVNGSDEKEVYCGGPDN